MGSRCAPPGREAQHYTVKGDHCYRAWPSPNTHRTRNRLPLYSPLRGDHRAAPIRFHRASPVGRAAHPQRGTLKRGTTAPHFRPSDHSLVPNALKNVPLLGSIRGPHHFRGSRVALGTPPFDARRASHQAQGHRTTWAEYYRRFRRSPGGLH
ncbi:hypothetical protein NDU88_000976 [Pleurodeles waltl]|uniref:Uncharacterized protein n=1 Tax=Pleurodeles waltl TaxID=8319 RepID=A0AAV7NIS9_PLEWA|nr:hypothetical protein NDU88_000976 [Pleurodeles waltl]